ncbi:hypothetical protein M527_14030 [Sphingobium indicum IP26]|nr:hypothetical protein M527_14030 [Sphingobium indicum IP26]
MLKYENETTINKENASMENANTKSANKSKVKIVAMSSLIEDAFSSDETDSWMKLLEAFRGKIAQDQKHLVKHEVAGHAILYGQLADAYRIGLQLISESRFKTLRQLSSRHSIGAAHAALNVVEQNQINRNWNAANPDEDARTIQPEISPWVYIVKLLYGTWFSTKAMTEIEAQAYGKKIGALTQAKRGEVKRHFDLGELAPVLEVPEQEKTVYQEWRPNRSSEKYAPVFRYLHNHGITPEDLPAYIETYKVTPHGARLAGIEAASRAEARAGVQPKPKSAEAIQREQDYVERAEHRLNWNVFEIETPPTFPQDFTYARAIIKQEGKSLVIVLTDDRDKPMAETAYTSQAIKLGKPLVEKDKEADKARQDELDAAQPAADSVVIDLTNMAAQAIANGADPAEIRKHQEEFFRSLNIKQQGTRALGGFATPDAI